MGFDECTSELPLMGRGRVSQPIGRGDLAPTICLVGFALSYNFMCNLGTFLIVTNGLESTPAPIRLGFKATCGCSSWAGTSPRWIGYHDMTRIGRGDLAPTIGQDDLV